MAEMTEAGLLDLVTGKTPQTKVHENQEAEPGSEETSSAEVQGGEGAEAQEEAQAETQLEAQTGAQEEAQAEAQEEAQAGAQAEAQVEQSGEVQEKIEESPEDSEKEVQDKPERTQEEPKKEIQVTDSEEYKKLQADLDKIKQERDEYEAMLSEADPMSYFANESEYKKQQILRDNPNINPEALDRVMGQDVQAMRPEDVLAMQLHLQNPGSSFNEARDYVLEKYDYDGEGAPSFGLKADANQAKMAISDIMNKEIQGPDNIKATLERKKADQNKKIEEAKQTFEPMVRKLSESMTGIEKSDGKDTYLKYDYDPKFKEQIPEGMMAYLLASGTTLDNVEQGLADAKKAIESTYIERNLKHIIKAHIDDAVKAKDDEWRAKVHNPKPTSQETNTQSKPKHTTVEDMINMVRRK